MARTAYAAARQLDELSHANFVPMVARWAVSFAVLVTRWHLKRHTRRQLARLDPHMLRDIGLSEAQAQHESTLPFWRN